MISKHNTQRGIIPLKSVCGVIVLISAHCLLMLDICTKQIVYQRWAKTGVPRENPPDPPVQNLASHMCPE